MHNYTFLSGGTGTPKLLEGFRKIVEDQQLSIIANTGDDYYWNSLLVCPDLDTILYLFSGKLDLEKYWGQKHETFNTLNALKSYEHAYDTWFNIGDQDLALHLVRNNLLKAGKTLSEITEFLIQEYNIQSAIYPMSDQKVTTSIHTTTNTILHFQEYFVRHKTEVEVATVKFSGHEQASIAKGANNALTTAKNIIIGPSNPITSIGPILSIDDIRKALKEYKTKTIVVSPIVNTHAFSGPTVKLMRAMQVEPSVIGLAKYYENYANMLILDPSDKIYTTEIENMNIEPIFMNISMHSFKEKQILAQNILDIL